MAIYPALIYRSPTQTGRRKLPIFKAGGKGGGEELVRIRCSWFQESNPIEVRETIKNFSARDRRTRRSRHGSR